MPNNTNNFDAFYAGMICHDWAAAHNAKERAAEIRSVLIPFFIQNGGKWEDLEVSENRKVIFEHHKSLLPSITDTLFAWFELGWSIASICVSMDFGGLGVVHLIDEQMKEIESQLTSMNVANEEIDSIIGMIDDLVEDQWNRDNRKSLYVEIRRRIDTN